jgi:alpha-ketoglutarate-dependent taurine dioxygenase
MKVKQLNNAVEAYDFDIYSGEHIEDLGRLVADKQVVFVDQKLDQKRAYDVQRCWGDEAHSIVHKSVFIRRLKGRHWNPLLQAILRQSRGIEDDYKGIMSVVSYQRDEKGRPMGVFANGKLDWHSDQVALDDGMRTVGLISVEHTEGSQTTFLSTAEAYDKLNHEDKSMVDELRAVYAWNKENFTGDLIDEQKQMVRYNQVCYDGMSCKLQQETASGVKGIHFPGTLFTKFEGMEVDESVKFKEYLWTLIDKPEYVYTHDWKDGQVMYMDQNITLHARPTDVKDGNLRYMWRVISYMNNLYPEHGGDWDRFTVDGTPYNSEDFLDLVDAKRLTDYEAGQKMAI